MNARRRGHAAVACFRALGRSLFIKIIRYLYFCFTIIQYNIIFFFFPPPPRTYTHAHNRCATGVAVQDAQKVSTMYTRV